MNSVSILSTVTFGFLLGLKHSIEADHLAAVATIASEQKSLLKSILVGGFWGLGHTFSLMIAGVAVVLLHIEMSRQFSLAVEFCVGLMLIGLGVNALRRLARGDQLHVHEHQHGPRAHTHPHFHQAVQAPESNSHHGLKMGAKPLVVGMLHGLAGSGALMLLILSTITRPSVAIFYILIFGAGATGGMMIMSALIGLPAKLTSTRFARVNGLLRVVAAVITVVVGVFTTYEISIK